MAVVRQRDDSGIEERADGSEFLAFQSLGDCPGAEDIHAGFACGFFFDPSDRRGAVGRGICIRHGDDGGESTGGCGARAAGHRLFVRLAWLAEMDMDVDQAGGHNQTGGVHGFRLLARHRVDDFAVGHPEVGVFLTVVGWIDDATVGDAGDFFHVGTPAPPAQE